MKHLSSAPVRLTLIVHALSFVAVSGLAAAHADQPAVTIERSGDLITISDEQSGARHSLTVTPVKRAGIVSIHGSDGRAEILVTGDPTQSYGYVLFDGRYSSLSLDSDGTVMIEPDGGRSMLGTSPATLHNDTVIDSSVIDEFSRRLEEEKRRGGAEKPGLTVAAGEVIDVAFFYDSSLVSREGPQSPHTRVQAAVDYMNAAFQASGRPLTVRAVVVSEFPGVLSLDPLGSLSQSTPANDIADRFGADLLHVIYPYNGQNYAGIAYILGRYAASSVDFDLSRVVAHEIGHNLGMNHDRANASPIGVAELDPFNYGYVCGGGGTIMSYPGNPRLPHYSDPDLAFEGSSCGVPEGQPESAHNDRVPDITAAVVEDYRIRPVAVGTVRFDGVLSIDVEEPAADSPIEIRVVRDGDIDSETSVEIATVDHSATIDDDYQALTQRLTFSAGITDLTVPLVIIDDDRFEPDIEELEIVLRYPIGLEVAPETVQVRITSDDLNRGVASFQDRDTSVWESVQTVDVLVQRLDSVEDSLVVDYQTFDISAVDGLDYIGASGQVAFEQGENLKQLSLQIADDDEFQGFDSFRQFGIQLTGDNVSEPASHVVSIFNDDWHSGRPQFVAASDSVTESSGYYVARLARIGGTEGPLSVEVSADSGSAATGVDFDLLVGGFNFPNGASKAFVPVRIHDNSRYSGDRAFSIVARDILSEQSSRIDVTIVEDDPDVGLARFAQSTLTVSESSGSAEILVVREGGTAGILTAIYGTTSGSAVAGHDFRAATGVITFAEGETEQIISIPIVSGSTNESSKQFTVDLYGINISAPAQIAVTVSETSAASLSSSAKEHPDADQKRQGGGSQSPFFLLALIIVVVRRLGVLQYREGALLRARRAGEATAFRNALDEMKLCPDRI